ncbi:Ribonuclease H-like superfamily [Sesbania bispinosa]|nr:Ribonuclease H-like superfamily [Sesbania bispinosa]
MLLLKFLLTWLVSLCWVQINQSGSLPMMDPFQLRQLMSVFMIFLVPPEMIFGRFIWSWDGPVRAKHFLWLAVKGGLKTNCLLWERGLAQSSLCAFCHLESETEKHLLLDCPVISNFWQLSGGRPVRALDSSLSVADWMIKNLKIHDVLVNGIPWSLLFGIACWAIWCARNAHIFRDQDWDQQRVFHFCVGSAKEFLNSHAANVPAVRASLHKEDKWIRWIPPDSGWIKWNLDGHIGITSITMAELWAFKDAVSLSINRGDDLIYFESDFAAAVNFIKMGVHQNHPCYALVSSIRHDLQRFQHFRISHSYREGNFAADFLARIGHSYQIGSHVVSEPPPSLSNILLGDSFGVSFVRCVAA